MRLTKELRREFPKVVVDFGEEGLSAVCRVNRKPCLGVPGTEHDFSMKTVPRRGKRILAMLSAKAPGCSVCVNKKQK